MTAAFADINNDGYPDLLYGQNEHLFLLLNDSARSFKDITASSGLKLTPGVTAAHTYRILIMTVILILFFLNFRV